MNAKEKDMPPETNFNGYNTVTVEVPSYNTGGCNTFSKHAGLNTYQLQSFN